jgi:hypothetical protein
LTGTQSFAGAGLALLFAAITVLYDCHVSIQDRLKRVPMPVYRVRSAIVFALVCGSVAAIAFFFTDGRGDSLVDSILGLKQANPLLRGLCVGLTVLVLIRSKLSSIQGAEIGGELVYNSGRVWVMRSLNSDWRNFKNKFNGRNLATALQTPSPDYENRLLEEVREIIKVQPEDYRGFVESQIANVLQSRPAVGFDPAKIEWQNYYRTLNNLALDYAGAEVFFGWTQFNSSTSIDRVDPVSVAPMKSPFVQEGALIRALQTPEVYFVQGGKRHYIPDPATLESRWSWGQVQNLPPDAVNAVPLGDAVPREGTLIRGPQTQEVYVVQGGKRHHIPNPATLESKWSWDQVRDIPQDAVDSVPLGDPILSIV